MTFSGSPVFSNHAKTNFRDYAVRAIVDPKYFCLLSALSTTQILVMKLERAVSKKFKVLSNIPR